jgi:hypothetical protein
VPGIAFPRVRPSITRRSWYSFCVRLDDAQLRLRRQEILCELNSAYPGAFLPSYLPLDRPELFRPELEPRYAGLWRFHDLRGADLAYDKTIRLPHYWLLAPNYSLTSLATYIESAIRRQPTPQSVRNT